MRIDVPVEMLKKSVRMIQILDQIELPEITDGDKQSDMYLITSNLMDLREYIIDELEAQEEYV